MERFKNLLIRRYLGEVSKASALYNLEIEQALLGSILINNDAFYRVSDFLVANHFYEPLHSEIFEIATTLIHGGKTANPVTVKTLLSTQTNVGDLSVPQYLAWAASKGCEAALAGDFGQIIYDLSIRRTENEAQWSS
ncbi:hypothetical protein GOA67_10805 [Sinorhizobium meliloti]|nr:hypothetical protein [Sinorhizobium meliloti]